MKQTSTETHIEILIVVKQSLQFILFFAQKPTLHEFVVLFRWMDM